MPDQFDHDKAAKDDIIARPDVTGEDSVNAVPVAPLKRHDGGKDTVADGGIIEPDSLEMAAGKVISRALDDLKGMAGMAADGDFTTLMTETLGGMFAALRGMSGKPWMRFAVAAGAIGFSIIPPALRYMTRKNEKKESEE